MNKNESKIGIAGLAPDFVPKIIIQIIKRTTGVTNSK